MGCDDFGNPRADQPGTWRDFFGTLGGGIALVVVGAGLLSGGIWLLNTLFT